AKADHQPIDAPPPRNRLAPADGDDMDQVVGLIASARRPLILAGRGAIGAKAELVRLAERIGAPLATTLKAKSLFQGEAYDLGIFGTLSTPAAGDAIAKSDLIIAFGAGLNRFTTARGGYLEGKRIIQINDDPKQIARLAPADAALAADPALAAGAIMRWLDEADVASSRAVDDLDPSELRAPHPIEKVSPGQGCVELTEALIRLNEVLPEGRLFVSDGGRFMGAAWLRIDVARPEDFLLPINTGSIGLGMCHAIGAAIARPEQPTVLATGDGGFMMGGLNEFAAAVREDLDLTIILCNDNAYGAEYVQFADRQMDPALSMFTWPSLAKVAEAMGGTGVQVTDAAGLDAACDAIAARSGPLLIELMLDPAAVPRLHI
ncbi:MAG: thiamine pyrophosphate-dependent enzyme, partial [Pseudomonadota bacterium]